MSKINEIRIKNFKFFRNELPIELNGKHLLLYGENGCGKSSIYYGLYTLLEASSKQPDEVKKYFDPSNRESLVNIYADCNNGAENTGAKILVTDTNEARYSLSYTDTSSCDNPDLIESNKASDFMNYRSLFMFQMFRNSEDTDIRDVFHRTILPTITFPLFRFKGMELRSASSMYKAYYAGPGTTTNANGKEILVYKNSPEYDEFLRLERHINNEVLKIIEFVNQNINDKIKVFDYDFKVDLEYKELKHDKKDTWVDYTMDHLYLKVTEYNGQQVDVCHPSTFLNEAKMSALAFCIRWTILDYRLQAEVAPNAIKVLAFDDVMISLDMANRSKMINLIVRKLSNDFQILFLTHDMLLFDCFKRELKSYLHLQKDDEFDNTDWVLKEMYDTEYDGIHQPFIQTRESFYAKARRYFDGSLGFVDNNACGNVLRQAIESAFKDLFQRANIRKNANGDPIEYNNLMIADCINLARTHYASIGLPQATIDKLETLRDCLLNAASHDNPRRNFYRQEIEDAFEVYETLTRCDFKVVVPVDSVVSFCVVLDNGEQHDYTVRLKKDLLAYKLIDNESYELYWELGVFYITYSKDPQLIEHKERNISLKHLYFETCEHYIKNGKLSVGNIQPAENVIIYNNKTLNEICAGM